MGKGYITMWEASDVLAFYGNLLASVATIASVVITILFTVYHQKKERKLTVKPYLQSESNPIFSPTEACEKKGGNTIFLTYPYKCTEGVSSSLLPPHILEKRSNPKKIKLDAITDKVIAEDFVSDNAFDLDIEHVIHFAKTSALNLDVMNLLEIMTASVIEFNKKYFILEYTISNVGAGTAISIDFKMDNIPCLPPFSLAKAERRNFIILLNSDLLNPPESTISLSFEYKDVISQSKYKQIERFTIYNDRDNKNENDILSVRQDVKDLISEPTEILYIK